MNSLPRPFLHPHAANNNICDCFTHYHDQSLIKDLPELFRCDWHYVEFKFAPVAVLPRTMSNPIIEDDIDCHLIAKYSLKQVVPQKEFSFHVKSKICVIFYSLISHRVPIEASLKKVFSHMAFLFISDPRLYPHQSKYHFCYSGFKVESDNNSYLSISCAQYHLLLANHAMLIIFTLVWEVS